ncbi:prolyl hydroxylase family protein [Alkalihalobacterium elongatum]|uniref:prolyl hydroxylase family protein n=1 Tax=Alkalihalobacterium elongatum TaxID=2675466 RepID=UPI001C201133|nr:2OG-Fe(II) oxygenase [Alkalihalobacterium elongatum]
MKKPAIIYHDKSPFVAYYENVANEKECQELIDLATGRLQPSAVSGYSKKILSNARKSEQAWFDHDFNENVQQVCERIASIVGQPLNHAEKLQVVRYQPGGKFDAHFDSFNVSSKLGRENLLKGGHRIYTAILYLNTVNAGGETFFPDLSLEVSPFQGNLLVFENFNTKTNRLFSLARHGSRSLKAGEKWITTLWFREKPQY